MTASSCLLCRTPLQGGGTEGFCCEGCARVHAVLSGLDESAGAAYLAAARSLGIIPMDGGGVDASAWAAEETKPSPSDASAVREERFRAEGMSCPACAWVMEKVLQHRPGVVQARFDFLTGTGLVSYDMRQTSADQLRGALQPLGYSLAPVRFEEQERLTSGVTFRLVVSAVLTMNLMSLSAVRYAFEVGWLRDLSPLIPYLELALCLPVLAVGLAPTARRAWEALRRRAFTMDLLITLSVLASFGLSLAAMVAGRPDIYFETAAVLVTIALLSRTIEARLRARALRDSATLMHMEAARVRADRSDQGESFLRVEDVSPGERLLFRPGEMVPFDGRCVNLDSVGCRISEAVLTGEPEPLRKLRGDRITAGSRLVEGELHLVVMRAFRHTRLAEITQAIRQGLANSETRLRTADRIAAWFVPAVVVLALGIWLVRAAVYGWGYALSAPGWFPSVAVLAVACPCAFSLAGATALLAGSGALLKLGFLVREQAQLEHLHRARVVVFDKTGTLTEGNVQVESIIWREGPRPELLALLLAAEQGSEHPIARAIRHHLVSQGVAETVQGIATELPSQGRSFMETGASQAFTVGRGSLFPDRFDIPGAQARHGLAWFGHAGRAQGCILISDRLRPGAAQVVANLRSFGLQVRLLSGDRQSVCDGLAAQLGIEKAEGDVSLDDKVANIQALEASGQCVVYVGDGTNDALAMAAASASVAIVGATDEALAASGFVLLRQDLEALPSLFAYSRRLRQVIRGNYAWAFAFNTLFIPVAALGFLTPLFAALLMLGSSAGVLLNSLRLARQPKTLSRTTVSTTVPR